jgi:hypothetical protein
VKLNALRKPAAKSPYVASHRPGVFSMSRAQTQHLKHMRNCRAWVPARPSVFLLIPETQWSASISKLFLSIAGDAFSYIRVVIVWCWVLNLRRCLGPNIYLGTYRLCCLGGTISNKNLFVCGPCSKPSPKLLAIDDFEASRGNVPTPLFLDLAVAVSV